MIHTLVTFGFPTLKLLPMVAVKRKPKVAVTLGAVDAVWWLDVEPLPAFHPSGEPLSRLLFVFAMVCPAARLPYPCGIYLDLF